MKHYILYLYAFCYLTVSVPSYAYDFSINTVSDLEYHCKKEIKDYQAQQLLSSQAQEWMSFAFCGGFIKGAMDSSIVYRSYIESHYYESSRKLLCTPLNWSVGQAKKVFLKWAANHPERLNEPAIVGFTESHKEAFPCATKK